MGKIIVGVDFSEGSEKAVALAVDIAKRFNDELQFVGVNETGLSKPDLIAEIHRRQTQHAEQLAGLKFEYLLRKGDVVDAICDQAAAVKASLVVVGTPVLAGLQKNFLGHKSYSLRTKSSSPVLCVRPDFQFNSSFRHILVPLDGSDTSRQKVPMAVRFAKAFGSTLHVVGVNSGSSAEERALVKSYIVQTKTYLDSIGVPNTLDQVDANGDVSKAVIESAKRLQADLVVMMCECGISLIKTLLGSEDDRLLSDIRIPIITIRPEQINNIRVI